MSDPTAATTSSRLSLFVSAHRHGPDAGALYERTLQLLAEAEAHGFGTVWVVARHFASFDAGLPSVLPFLAAAAQRTSSLRLGTGVIPLVFENEIRLAEDAAITDLLARGRLELGLGQGQGNGWSDAAHAAFDVPADDRELLFNRKVFELERLLGGGEIPEAGAVWPQSPGLSDRIWQAASTPELAAGLGRRGYGLLLNRTAKTHPVATWQSGLIDAYLDAFDSCDRDRAPRVGVVRVVYPGATEQEALDLVRRLEGSRAATANVSLATDADVRAYAHARHLFVGTTEQIADALNCDDAVRRSTEVIFALPEHADLSASVADLEAVARDVEPALHTDRILASPVGAGT